MLKLTTMLRCRSCELHGACHENAGVSPWFEHHIGVFRQECQNTRKVVAVFFFVAAAISLLSLSA